MTDMLFMFITHLTIALYVVYEIVQVLYISTKSLNPAVDQNRLSKARGTIRLDSPYIGTLSVRRCVSISTDRQQGGWIAERTAYLTYKQLPTAARAADPNVNHHLRKHRNN